MYNIIYYNNIIAIIHNVYQTAIKHPEFVSFLSQQMYI